MRRHEDIPSLYNIVLQNVTNNFKMESNNRFATLPPNIKDALRRILLKRGLSGNQLKPLLHPNVKDLDLSDCSKNSGLLMSIQPLRNLRKLHMNCPRARPSTRPNQLTTDQLCLIIKNNTNLQSLFLRNIPSITDKVLECFNINLVELDLGGCENITDHGVLKVVEKCPNLSSLSFSRTNITDETLVKLSVSDCKSSLTELNVSGCRFITDQGVEMFLTGLQSIDQPPVLNILVLHKCPLLTEVSTELINQFFCDNNVKVKQLSWTIS